MTAHEKNRRDDNERLTRLNEDKFSTIQAYCKAADEDKATISALRARLAAADALIEAAVILRQRLSLVHENPLYRGVWATAQNHQGPYNGPTYIDELVLFDDALSAYRAAAPEEETK